MKLRLMIVIALIFALPIPASAVTALEVQPQDVYRAAYCAEINRISGFPEYEQVSETVTEKESPFEGMILSINLEPEMPEVREDPISKLATQLITGGDNLEFVHIGIEDARREMNSVSISELTQCNIDLMKILANYEWMSCGYGQKHLINYHDTYSFLKRLNITQMMR